MSSEILNLRYGKALKIPRKIFKHFLSWIYPVIIRKWPLPNVLSVEETIIKIMDDNCSIVRYGDGEILYITDKLNLPFQEYDEELSNRLKEILLSDIQSVLIGLPIGYQSLVTLLKENRLFWRSQISWNYPRFRKFLNLKKQYYNASITRLYYGYVNTYPTGKYFSMMKRIWEGKKILLIEGEKSRFGVGNDLLRNAASVERILGPANHAYRKNKELFEEAMKHGKDKLVLVALGPAAKVLTFDLACSGFQAIDIGNLDLEYEWFMMGVDQRVKIRGKYTSEVKGGRIVEDINDPIYEKQITARIV